MALGDRLREERERLRLSQADFADRAGIHRNTQVRYESDKREPDSGYLETLRLMGVDVDYILFGVTDDWVECPFLVSKGFDNPRIFLKDCRRNAAGLRVGTNPMAVEHYQACRKCPKNPIQGTTKVLGTPSEVDGRLLATVIEAVESCIEKKKVIITPRKKARIVTLIYRTSVATGVVDQKAVKDAVAVAD